MRAAISAGLIAPLLCSACALLDSSEQTSLVAGGAVPGLDPASAGQGGSSEAGEPAPGDLGGAGAGSMEPLLGPPLSARSPAPIMELPQVLAVSQCVALDQCLTDTALQQLLGDEDCVARTSEELLATAFDGVREAVEAGRLLYDPAGLEVCLSAIEALACDVRSHAFPTECARVLVGNVGLGGECGGHLECGAGAFCRVDEGCVARCAERLAAGDACAETRACADGLVCDRGTCVMPSPEGAECGGEAGATCELGLECVATSPGASGRCIDPTAQDSGGFGEPCEPARAHCADGLACLDDADGGFACIEPAGDAGASCVLGLPGECAPGEYCDLSAGLLAGTCRELPAAGEPCAGLGLCRPGHVCVPGATPPQCQPIVSNGQPCLIDAMCRSNHCVDLVCAAPTACQ